MYIYIYISMCVCVCVCLCVCENTFYTGGRPKYLDIANDRDLCITSDDLFSLSAAPGNLLYLYGEHILYLRDLFSLSEAPGKTLVVFWLCIRSLFAMH